MISSLRALARRTNKLFALTVLLPTAVSTVYFGAVSSDVYISESRFVVRSPDRQAVTGLGALLRGVGFSKSQDDTYAIHDYMLSRDALAEVNKTLPFEEKYGSDKIDRFSRFNGLNLDGSFEALHQYYQDRIQLTLDSTSAISSLKVRAFTPEDARAVNQLLLDLSEKLINQLNERGRNDVVQYAAKEVAEAEAKAKAAALAMASYRSDKAVFDPDRQSAIQLQLVSKLQDELISTRKTLTQLQSLSPQNAQVQVLKDRVDYLEKEIGAQMHKVAGGAHSLSNKSADYERLLLDRTFAEKQLAAAMSNLEQVRNDAQRKQLYLERIVQPNLPDVAVEPRRLRAIFTTFLLGLVAWGVVSIMLAGIREHRD